MPEAANSHNISESFPWAQLLSGPTAWTLRWRGQARVWAPGTAILGLAASGGWLDVWRLARAAAQHEGLRAAPRCFAHWPVCHLIFLHDHTSCVFYVYLEAQCMNSFMGGVWPAHQVGRNRARLPEGEGPQVIGWWSPAPMGWGGQLGASSLVEGPWVVGWPCP